MVVVTIGDVVSMIFLGLFIIGGLAIWILAKIEDFKWKRKNRKLRKEDK